MLTICCKLLIKRNHCFCVQRIINHPKAHILKPEIVKIQFTYSRKPSATRIRYNVVKIVPKICKNSNELFFTLNVCFWFDWYGLMPTSAQMRWFVWKISIFNKLKTRKIKLEIKSERSFIVWILLQSVRMKVLSGFKYVCDCLLSHKCQSIFGIFLFFLSCYFEQNLLTINVDIFFTTTFIGLYCLQYFYLHQ